MSIFNLELQMAGTNCCNSNSSRNNNEDLSTYYALAIRTKSSKVRYPIVVTSRNTLLQPSTVVSSGGLTNRDNYATQTINETAVKVCF